MRALKSIVFFLLTVLIFSSSCQSDPQFSGDALGYIPNHASSITVLNIDRLMDKGDFTALKTTGFFRHFIDEVEQDNPAFAKVLQDPIRAGVDLNQNIYLSMSISKPTSDGFAALLFSIADTEAFEQTLTDMELQFSPVAKGTGYLQEGSGMAMLWNDEVGIVGIGHVADVYAQTEAYLNTREDQSIRNNKNFTKALSKDFDVLNWMSSKALVEELNLAELRKFGRFTEEDLANNYVHSVLQFKDGEINAASEIFLQRKLASDLALVLKKNVKSNFGAQLPHDNLLLYSNLAINPKGINQLLIEYHVKGLSDQSAQAFGVNFDDVVKAFDGDAALAIYQGNDEFFQIAKILVVLKIDKHQPVKRLLEAGIQENLVVQLADNRYQIASSIGLEEAQVLIKDDLLYLSDQSDLLDLVASGQYNRNGTLPKMMKALARKNAFIGLLDMQQANKVTDDFGDFPMETIQYSANRKGGGATMLMKDKKSNSLKQLIQWMEEQYQKEQDLQKNGGTHQPSNS